MLNALLFALCTLIWGTTWYAIEFQLGVVPQAWSVSYRFGLSALLLFALALIQGKSLRFPRSAHRLFLGIGCGIFCFNYLLVYWGTAYLASGLVATAFSALSLFNLLNGRIFLGQPTALTMLVGAGAGSFGLALVFWPEVRQLSLGDEGLWGLMLVLAGAYCASAGNTALATKTARALPPMRTNAWAMAYGSLVMALFAALTAGPPVLDLSLRYLLSLGYLVVWGTVLSFTLYVALLGRIGLGPAGYIAVMTPLVALTVSTFAEGYRWTALSLTGVGLILLGNVLIRAKALPGRRLLAKTRTLP